LIDDATSYKTLLKVAMPLILQMSSVMVMQIIDAIFLSRYSPEAVAAVITAGLTGWLITCVFSGTAGFTSTLVAQYVGAGQEGRAPEIIRNGIYFSILSSCVVAAVTLISGYLFQWAGHAPIVRQYETLFFNYLCWSAFFNIGGAAIAGYFSGLGKTTPIMVGQLVCLAVTSALDYLLIFGNLGFPRLGVTGAAIATVCGQASDFIFLAIAYWLSIKKLRLKPVRRTAMDWQIMKKLMRFGFPSGIRAFIDMLAWTVFPFFVGRIGTLELAASNIAFRINVIAIFPVLGLSVAVGILVGQSQGAKRPDLSSKIWRRGMILSLAFTGILGLSYLVLPHMYYSIFYSPQAMSPEYFASLSALGAMMLRLVAIYCLFDTINIITLGLLQGAGDTRWTMIAAVFLYAVFFGALFWIDHVHGSVKTLWIAATAFTITQSFLWTARLLSGRWKTIEIVEEPGIEVRPS
jgi:multidrug resistance protein, MATE family